MPCAEVGRLEKATRRDSARRNTVILQGFRRIRTACTNPPGSPKKAIRPPLTRGSLVHPTVRQISVYRCRGVLCTPATLLVTLCAPGRRRRGSRPRLPVGVHIGTPLPVLTIPNSKTATSPDTRGRVSLLPSIDSTVQTCNFAPLREYVT